MRLTRPIPADFLLSIRIVERLVAAVFLISVAIAAYSLGYHEAEEATSALYSKVWASGVDSRSLINKLHIAIIICLALSFLGIWTKKLIGVFVSLLGFIGVVAIYFWWYKISTDLLRGVELMYFPDDIAHLGPLIDATWWDIMVFVAVLCLMILVSVILLGALKRASVSSLDEDVAAGD